MKTSDAGKRDESSSALSAFPRDSDSVFESLFNRSADAIWLYDPETMPASLLKAHRDLDDTLERIYIGRPFKNDTERLEHLFKLYAATRKKKDAAKTAKKEAA